MNTEGLKELIYKMADDLLILGHRNSEWTGFGPLLEEDIAFSSMAQDKVGQSWQLYKILNTLGENDPDTVAFMRNSEQFHNSQFCELPNGEYDFSLIRHFLFDTADLIRYQMLSNSAYTDLANLAKKVKGETKYHSMHAKIWIKQLGSATTESIRRLQQSLDYALPYALGMFETSPFEQENIDSGVFAGEEALMEAWKAEVEKVISETQLLLPDWSTITPVVGGRKGVHTEYLQPLLDEMSEVFKVDPTADW